MQTVCFELNALCPEQLAFQKLNLLLFLSDREGQGHRAVVYKSHFPATKALDSQTVVTETPTDTLANKPRLTKDQALCYICPHDMVAAWI